LKNSVIFDPFFTFFALDYPVHQPLPTKRLP
jgi:hypothetical protein